MMQVEACDEKRRAFENCCRATAFLVTQAPELTGRIGPPGTVRRTYRTYRGCLMSDPSYPPPAGQGPQPDGHPEQSSYPSSPPYDEPRRPPQYDRPAQQPDDQDPGTFGFPPAPPGRSRTGLGIGLVAGVALLLLLLGIGGVLVLPRLLGDDKTPAGAKAAAQRGQELLARGDYGGYYDMTDNEYKARVSRTDFIRVSTCASASANSAKNTIVAVDAHVNGDTATVEVTVGNGGHGTIELVWQDNHWRFKVGSSLSAQARDAYKTMCE